MQKVSEVVKIAKYEHLAELLGILDENLDIIGRETNTQTYVVDNDIKISGEKADVQICVKVINKLYDIVKENQTLDKNKIMYCIELAKEGNTDGVEKVLSGVITVTANGKQIKYKTLGQKKYVESIKNNTVVFSIGPAGTGKTYLAVAMAVSAYKNKEVEKIILTRPAVEAGERLGFLPGDLQSKVDPYLRPLYDALQEMFGLDTYQKLIERGVIEIAPLAYMRGRTLSNAFIILDEAQNTTREQMKMFLTRMGEGSKMVITGDLTQMDLPEGKTSGLKHSTTLLKNIEGIDIIELTSKDVVRHSLVMKIIKAYSVDEQNNAKKQQKYTFKDKNKD